MGMKSAVSEIKHGTGPWGIVAWVSVAMLIVVPLIMMGYSWVKAKWFSKPATA